MGFLMGAYGKLMAGKYLRNLQYELMNVTSQHRKVARQLGDMQKMMSSQKRNMQAMMQSQMQYGQMGLMAALFPGMAQNGMNPLGFVAMAQNGQFDQQSYMYYTSQQQQMQQQFAMANSMWENMFEMQQESMLQPLKDLEEDLQIQKDNLESRIKVAETEYNAYKEEEKAGAQNLKPEITGQG